MKKLGIFTLVNAEEKNGTIYIYAVPDIRLFKRKTENYFTIPLVNSVQNTALDRRKNVSQKELEKLGKKAENNIANTALSSAFELDSYERQKITNYLRSSGVIQLTRKFVIRTPNVSRYIMEVHVIRFKADELEKVFCQINETGYGLTMGIHSRLESTIAMAERLAKVGNLYINRNMIGAVVGVQPFGGEGLSGTGPKAGGPNYLFRFVHERTFTHNITACGGNTTLLSSI